MPKRHFVFQGGPGQAELRALEKELLAEEEFDPREGGELPKGGAYGGKPRPVRGNSRGKLEIRAPPPQQEDPEEEEEDPFDTSIVDKVIPVRKAQKRSEISVEDQDFDPTQSFKAKVVEVDPFDTSVAGAVIPELAEKEVPQQQQQEESAAAIQHSESIDSDDFDPRAF